MLEAWRQIDAGRRDSAADTVADGNRTLLFREQHDIIDRYYARMFAYRWPLGRTFTYVLTLAGSPSVPRARSFRSGTRSGSTCGYQAWMLALPRAARRVADQNRRLMACPGR